MSGPAPRLAEAGFTYFALLFFLAVSGLAMAAAGNLWSLESRRTREQQLLWVGAQYRQAIGSYYLYGPGGARVMPPDLESLLEDRRTGTLRRHLRRLYPDPMTGKTDWNLLLDADGGVRGVSSSSAGTPVKRRGFALADADFEDAETYGDWAFVASAETLGVGAKETRWPRKRGRR